MNATGCPSQAEWSDFALGNLARSPFSRLARHLAGCRQCQAALQALVSLDKTKIVVKMNQPIYQPKQVADATGRPPVTTYEVIYTLHTQRYERAEVEVYDTRRRKLDNKELAKRLKEEIPALVLAGTRQLDPLHRRGGYPAGPQGLR